MFAHFNPKGYGMDPVTLIVAALTAGVSAGISDSAKEAVHNTYKRLRAALGTRFGGDPVANQMLERHAKNPGGYDAAMRDVVEESGVGGDADIVGLARELLSAADPAGAQVGKYNVHIASGQVGAIGDHATVNQTFGT